MNLNLRHRIAATGAATVLTALGAFATMAPASASPAHGSPGTLSGNIAHVPTHALRSDLATNQGPFGVDSITEQEFNSHGDSEYGDNCAQTYSQTDPVKYCEYYQDGYNAGTTWDAYIAIPQGTTLDATVTLNYTDSMTGEAMKVTGPVHADSPYIHLSAGVSQWTQDQVATDVTITLSDGSVDRAFSQFTLDNGVYSGRVYLSQS